MAGDDAAEPPAGAAVLAVLADLRYWSDRGVQIAAVEPAEARRAGRGPEPPHHRAAGAEQSLLVLGELLVVPVSTRT
jgi:hypothetical protein